MKIGDKMYVIFKAGNWSKKYATISQLTDQGEIAYVFYDGLSYPYANNRSAVFILQFQLVKVPKGLTL